MKIDWTVFLTVILALVAFKVLDKMVLDKTLGNVFNWETEGYDDYDDYEDFETYEHPATRTYKTRRAA